MAQTTQPVGIIGGGLSGVYAARLLEQAGITSYVLLEARAELGGRLRTVTGEQMGSPINVSSVTSSPIFLSKQSASVNSVQATPRYDLGAAWFWPKMQPALAKLIRSLGLDTVSQYESGDVTLECAADVRPELLPGDKEDEMGSTRIVGGMTALVQAGEFAVLVLAK